MAGWARLDGGHDQRPDCPPVSTPVA